MKILPERRIRQILKDDARLNDDYGESLKDAASQLEMMRSVLIGIVEYGRGRQDRSRYTQAQAAHAKAWEECADMAEAGLILDTSRKITYRP